MYGETAVGGDSNGSKDEAANRSSGSRLLSLNIDHAGVQAATQPWLEMECYQLSRGKRLAQMRSLDLGDKQIVVESQAAAVQKLGVTPADFCTVSCCTPDPNARFSSLDMPDDKTIFFMPGNTEFDIYVPAGARTSYIGFSQEAFLAGARALDPEGWELAPDQVLMMQTRQGGGLADVLATWLSSTVVKTTAGTTLPGDDSLSNFLLHDILQIAVHSGSDVFPVSRAERARAYHICRKARLLIDDYLAVDRVPSVVELCLELGVSERTLQYAFRAYVNMTPLTYVRLCRLNRVRETLLAEDPGTSSVTVIAMRFGFFHLGRFAADYKRVFDEPPSVTLATEGMPAI